MPRYFFDVIDGLGYRDDVGHELADHDAARTEAARFAGRLLADHAQAFWQGEDWQINVRNEDGLVLFGLIFAGVAAPAVRLTLVP